MDVDHVEADRPRVRRARAAAGTERLTGATEPLAGSETDRPVATSSTPAGASAASSSGANTVTR